MSVLGAMVVAEGMLGISWVTFVARLRDALAIDDVFVGLKDEDYRAMLPESSMMIITFGLAFVLT